MQAASNTRRGLRGKDSGAAAPSTSGNASKRLQVELRALTKAKKGKGDEEEGVSAFPSSDSILQWRATIEGPSSTPYSGMQLKLNLEFPSNYPFSPPTVTFITPLFHPNVDDKGNICLDILQDKWSAIYNVKTVLLSIRSLLAGNCVCDFIPFLAYSLRQSQTMTLH
mmetsp:Transcript_41622/g.107683  ORF Transcript_41622/g.107683 Transcript_41622/m.107683 type:complete len:167 (-) Transcript_41622:306-806(-)